MPWLSFRLRPRNPGDPNTPQHDHSRLLSRASYRLSPKWYEGSQERSAGIKRERHRRIAQGVRAYGLADAGGLRQPAKGLPSRMTVQPSATAGDEQRTVFASDHKGIDGRGRTGNQGTTTSVAPLRVTLSVRCPRS